MKLAILSLIFALTTQSAYVQKYSHLAKISSQKHGIPFEIIMAQAILESGNGTSKLAKTKNNHFGIKKRGKYAAFGSVAECFEAHGKIFAGTRYKKCRECKDDVNCWAYELGKSGYAVAPDYSEKILKIIKQNKLCTQ